MSQGKGNLAEKDIDGLQERWRQTFGGVNAATVEAIARLGAISRELARFHGGVLQPLGLRHSDYQVISILLTGSHPDGLSPKRLSQLLRQTPAGVTKTLDRLEALSAVRRVRRSKDRRAVSVELTASGRRLAERACLSEFEAQQELFGSLSDQEIDDLNGMLGRLLAAFPDP